MLYTILTHCYSICELIFFYFKYNLIDSKKIMPLKKVMQISDSDKTGHVRNRKSQSKILIFADEFLIAYLQCNTP